MTRILDCICGHRHAHKSRCTECVCRYGTDNRTASDRIIAGSVNRRVRGDDPGMKALRRVFTPAVIAQAMIETRTAERGGQQA